jgi:hypothetical protein
VLPGTSTVWEYLTFHARLRMPQQTGSLGHERRVWQVLEQLRLTKVRFCQRSASIMVTVSLLCFCGVAMCGRRRTGWGSGRDAVPAIIDGRFALLVCGGGYVHCFALHDCILVLVLLLLLLSSGVALLVVCQAPIVFKMQSAHLFLFSPPFIGNACARCCQDAALICHGFAMFASPSPGCALVHRRRLHTWAVRRREATCQHCGRAAHIAGTAFCRRANNRYTAADSLFSPKHR